MMDIDGGLWLVGALLCGLALPLFLLVAGYFGLRAFGGSSQRDELDSARALLDRRLAAGEIETEEYYEREAALRNAQPPADRRRGRRR
jgi:uncharacterized membrane protein